MMRHAPDRVLNVCQILLAGNTMIAPAASIILRPLITTSADWHTFDTSMVLLYVASIVLSFSVLLLLGAFPHWFGVNAKLANERWEEHTTQVHTFFVLSAFLAGAVNTTTSAGMRFVSHENSETSELVTLLASVCVILACVILLPRMAISTLQLTASTRQARADQRELAAQTKVLRWVSHEVRIPAQVLSLSLESASDTLVELQTSSIGEDEAQSARHRLAADLSSARATTQQLVAVLTASLEYARLQNGGDTMKDSDDHIVDANVLPALHTSLRSVLPACRTLDASIFMYLTWDDTVAFPAAEEGVQVPLDKLEFPENLPALFARLPLMRVNQLLLNMISNSLKYHRSGDTSSERSVASPPCIKVFVHAGKPTAAQKQAGAQYALRISVQDNGRGMRSDEMQAIFRPFAQLRTADRQRGSGLGLYMASEWVRGQGGSISCYSPGPDLGSTFTVSMPLQRAHSASTQLNSQRATRTMVADPRRRGTRDEDSSEATNPVLSPTTAKPRQRHQPNSPAGSGLRVLVVDDSSMVRKLVRRTLSKYGAHVDILECQNGREAVSSALSEELDVIFIDNEMPEMTGQQAVPLIRANGCAASIVGLTGNGSPEDRLAFVQAGADEVLVKPVTKEQLYSVLDAAAAARGCDVPAQP